MSILFGETKTEGQLTPMLRNEGAGLKMYNCEVCDRLTELAFELGCIERSICSKLCGGVYIDNFRQDFWEDNNHILSERINQGAFGQVWKIKSKADNYKKEIALKIFWSSLPDAERAAYNEALAIAIVTEKCPDILARRYNPIEILNPVNPTERVFAIPMELVPGQDMSKLLQAFHTPANHHAFPPDGLKALGITLLKQLVCLHDNNITHRDIKPSNIVVHWEGLYEVIDAKLIDFGFACIAGNGTSKRLECREKKGTATFVPPEWHGITDMRNMPIHIVKGIDVFSLGASLFSLALGRAAFVNPATQDYRDSFGGPPYPHAELYQVLRDMMILRSVKRLSARKALERFESIVI